MGNYNLSHLEIFEAVEEALDNLEGDFTEKQLKEVLMFFRHYPYVSDKTKSEKVWNDIKRHMK